MRQKPELWSLMLCWSSETMLRWRFPACISPIKMNKLHLARGAALGPVSSPPTQPTRTCAATRAAAPPPAPPGPPGARLPDRNGPLPAPPESTAQRAGLPAPQPSHADARLGRRDRLIRGDRTPPQDRRRSAPTHPPAGIHNEFFSQKPDFSPNSKPF
jgi:hypothetical protein